MDYNSIDQYFHFYYVPEPATMFKNIKKLPAGKILVIDLKTMDINEIRYWNPSNIKPFNNEDPTEKIKDSFSEACELTLRSDVPVGIALSGGIDSGSILSFSAPKYKDTMKAFSIGYEGEPPSDEREMAMKLCKKFNVEFIEDEIKDKDIIDNFPQTVFNTDDPVADISGFAFYSVARLARKNEVKVLLAGVGGDELFWGYPWLRNTTQLTIDKFKKLKNPSIKSLRKYTETYQKPRVYHANNPLSILFTPENQIIFSDQRPNFRGAEYFISHLYHKDFRKNVNENNSFTLLQWDGQKNELAIAKHMMDLIRETYLFSSVIPQSDRLAMATSVENRSPFLDYKFIETILSSKKTVRGYKNGQKYWFKKAMKGVLPDEVMERPKRGFTPPVRRWVWGILKNYSHLLNDGFLAQEQILDAKKLKILQKTWVAVPFLWYQVYQLLVMEIWGRYFVYDEVVHKNKN